MGAVWDADLPRPEKFVLLSYADHAAHDGTSIYPSVERMAWKTGYSERSIQRITRDLEDAGILVRDGTGPNGVNKYRIEISNLPGRQPYQRSDQGGDKISPQAQGGVTFCQGGGDILSGGVTKSAERGDKMSPKPSLTVKEPSKNRHCNLSPSQEMFGRLAELCQIELDLITQDQRGKLNKVAKKLLDAGKTLDHIGKFETYWYTRDWRGKKGQPPGPWDVVKEWGRARAWLCNGGEEDGNGNGNRGAPATREERKLRQRKDPSYNASTPEEYAELERIFGKN
jgi:hypothetical protein